jgi:uncharacterized protein YndB with AHSA1/START domain
MPIDLQADHTSFVYTTYIHATRERVWQGLTDPELTMRWWRHHLAGGKTFVSDWKKGSTYDMLHPEVGLVVSHPAQVILASDPYRRLAYRWHTFTPDWAARVAMDEATATAWRSEPLRRSPSTSRAPPSLNRRAQRRRSWAPSRWCGRGHRGGEAAGGCPERHCCGRGPAGDRRQRRSERLRLAASDARPCISGWQRKGSRMRSTSDSPAE